MASKAISVGVGIPMIVVAVEFVGSLIGILGVVFFISGLFYAKEAVLN
jgi:hypothetical protein